MDADMQSVQSEKVQMLLKGGLSFSSYCPDKGAVYEPSRAYIQGREERTTLASARMVLHTFILGTTALLAGKLCFELLFHFRSFYPAV